MPVIDKIAWILLDEGRVLAARSRGRDVFYLPGGKRDPGESDVETLVREIREELSVTVDPDSAEHVTTVEAPAHGKSSPVRMACYSAAYDGNLKADNEIEEIRWLSHADRGLVSDATRLVLDQLHRDGLLP